MRARLKKITYPLLVIFLFTAFSGCAANQNRDQASNPSESAYSQTPDSSMIALPSATALPPEPPIVSETALPEPPAVSESPSPSATAEVQPMTLKKFADIRPLIPGAPDIRNMDLTNAADILPTLCFNEKVVWPDKSLLPPGFDPSEVMKNAMNPGLGVRDLHNQGITGEGVNVAIIDQPLYQDHPEFSGKFAAYKDFNCQSESSMHGPAVSSLLAGENIGTAPGARIYYAAVPSWFCDAQFYADALLWIIDENRKLPENQKIRVVSVSAAPSGTGSPFTKNNDSWDEAVKEAEGSGLIVLDCTVEHGFIGPCFLSGQDPENPQSYSPGFPSDIFTIPGAILAPASPRTTAEEYVKGDFTYQYTGRGGLSWTIPYCAGVMAMGWQLRPDLTGSEMKELLFKSAYSQDGSAIIDPPEFIIMVKEYNK